MCTTIIDKDIIWYGAVNALGYATEEDNVIKNDGRDWRHFEMPNWHFILIKWVCISQSIQKSSNPFQFCKHWKEFGDFPVGNFNILAYVSQFSRSTFVVYPPNAIALALR